ncbi:MAG: glycosyltransferase family 4 protein [Sphingorhabdus sp.]|nr:glycosyltransferase family 4 protein [Sphingorhabdus sp.]
MAPDLLIDVTRLIWRRWAGRHPTGIDRVCLAYLEHYQTRAQAVIQYPNFRRILSPDISASLFQLLLHDQSNFRQRLIVFGLRNIVRAVKSSPSLGRYYLNVGHTGLDHPGHIEWVRRSGVKPIYFVHDLIPITHPQFCREGEAEKHKARMTAALQSAHGIIGNSQDTLAILTKFAGSADLPVPKMTAAHLGTAEMAKTDNSRASFAQPYFVMLSTIEGRKNHTLLLDVWQKMIALGVGDIPQLIIIGQRGWQCEDVTNRLDNDEQLKPHIAELSNCTDEEIARYLRGARALLFPSFAEGYGMPLMEALIVGTPVIASDIAVFREIAGGVPEYLDPNDREMWLSTILQYQAEPSAQREKQQRRISKLKPPSWQDHFNQIDFWLPTLPDGPGEAD